MARRVQIVQSETEPSILYPFRCQRCITCPECGGTGQRIEELHTLPYPVIDARYDSELDVYQVNGHIANKAAFDLALRELWG